MLVQTQGQQIRAIHDTLKAKAFVMAYTATFTNGDNATSTEEFDGLKNRLTGDQVLAMGSTDGGNDVLYMNQTLRRKVNALMRAAGQASETVPNGFGKLDGTTSSTVASKIRVAYDRLVTGEYSLLEPTDEQIKAARIRMAKTRAK